MNRNLILFISLIAAVGIFLLLFVPPPPPPPSKLPFSIRVDNLDSTIYAAELGLYKASLFDSVENAIFVFHSNGQINLDRKSALLVNLQNSLQSALIHSFEDFFQNNCGSSIESFSERASRISNPNAELNEWIKEYNNFKNFMSLEQSLTRILSSEYNASEKNSLIQRANTLKAGRCSNCQMVNSLYNRIQQELEDFRGFHDNFWQKSILDKSIEARKNFLEKIQLHNDETVKEINRYSYYKAEMEKIINQP